MDVSGRAVAYFGSPLQKVRHRLANTFTVAILVAAAVIEFEKLGMHQVRKVRGWSWGRRVVFFRDDYQRFRFDNSGSFLHRTAKCTGNVERHHRLSLADLVVCIGTFV